MTEPLPDLKLDLPPLLTGRPVVPPDTVQTAARRALDGGGAEAGHLFWSCDPDQVGLALVLEPEVGPDRAQEMLFALMVSCGDAIGSVGPPELAFTWTWPDRFRANGASVGRAFLEISPDLDGDGAPLWLIAGLDLRLRPYPEIDPGDFPDRTSLWDEGAADLGAPQVIEAWSRHMLSWINRWEGDGFKPVHDAWLFRCNGFQKDVRLAGMPNQDGEQGRMLGLDETGNCLLAPAQAQRAPATRVVLVRDALACGANVVPIDDVKGD
ncbi:biotin/lipoate--protein ligase family protein [Roseibium aquae]|nr:biotin/lipoate--protein ligase family protein [Roseibium aquae]